MNETPSQTNGKTAQAGYGASHMHPYSGAYPGDTAAGLPAEIGFDFWGMVARGKWLILLSVAVGLSLAYWQFVRTPPVYRSHARLLLSHEGAELPVRGLETAGEVRQEFNAQSVLVRSPQIVKRALRERNLASLASLADALDPTATIISGLRVEADERGVLDLTFDGANADDCRTILDAVVASYRAYLEERHQSFGEETVLLIKKAKDELLERLNRLEAEYRRFRAEAPPIWKGDGETNIYRSRLVSIEEARSKLLLERDELVAEVRAIERALKEGGNREAIRMMVGKLAERAESPSQPTSPADQLFPLLLEEQLLLDRLGPDHPDVRRLRKRIELTRQYLEGSTDDEKPKTEQEQPRKDFVSVYLDSVRHQLQATEMKLAEWDALLAKERENLKKSLEIEDRDNHYRSEIARLKSLFEAVVGRLSEIDLVKDFGGFRAEVISPPGSGVRVAPNLPQYLAIGGVVSLLLGLVLAYAREKHDYRFVAPEDVHWQLGAPVFGHIPDLRRSLPRRTNGEMKPDPVVCTWHNPKSPCAEAFRAVRTAMYFSTHGSGRKVIQVTSPSPGDGKSTLAANLAVSMARSGRSTLLMEADFRRPSVDRLFGLNSQVGITDLMRGTVDLPDAVCATGIDNLWCLPCGSRPDDPAELLSSADFERVVELVREKYDYVIIDSPPVLAVTDPSAVAARVDGVLMTILLRRNTRAAATRAVEMLRTVGATILGIVVNGVGRNENYGYARYGRYGAGPYGDLSVYSEAYVEQSGPDNGSARTARRNVVAGPQKVEKSGSA